MSNYINYSAENSALSLSSEGNVNPLSHYLKFKLSLNTIYTNN